MRYRFKKHPSKLSALAITFGAGSRAEYKTNYPTGQSHFMEHMRFKSTKTRSAKDLLRTTADAGGSWNAWTSNNLVSYYMTIPEENLEIAFDCLSDIILNSTFPKDELVKEQEVVCQEIRMYDDQIDHLVDCKLMEVMFDNSMVDPICGTAESVRSITKQNLLDFNAEFYSPEHMLITLGASSDHRHLVDKYFGDLDNTLLFSGPTKNVVYGSPGSHEVHKKGQLQDSIAICFGGQKIRSLAKKHRAATTIFTSIFGSGDTSRLWMKIREDLGLVYGVGSYLGHHMDGSLYEIYASTEPKNSKLLIEAVDEEIEKILNEAPSKKELSRAKNIIKSQFYRTMDTSYGSSSTAISEEFFGYTVGSKFIAEIAQVSLEDVQEVAEKIFSESRYVVIGTGG